MLKENQTLIGILNPYSNKEKIDNLVKKKINVFSLELLPRITPLEVDTLLGNSRKAKKELNWRPKTSFKELVREMMAADLNLE